VKLLVTGAAGQVGWQLQRTLAPLGEVVALTRAELDLADPELAANVVREIRPDVLVNAAAYTAVDKAESEPELAHTVNAVAPGLMARQLAQTGGLMIHYSTDYVFDGTKAEAYTEEDATGPLNQYGRSKLAGEQAIAESGCAHVILRTSWVYDTRGQNFLRRVLRLAREKHELRMVDDQHGAPTWARSIAEATAAIVAKSSRASSITKSSDQPTASNWEPTGIYHLTASGATTWAGFAQTILDTYEQLLAWPADSGEFSGPLLARHVVPIASTAFKSAARRPANSRLSNAKLKRDFDLSLPDWKQLLRLALLETIR
jgi:dTDP-4-dehydrorhamnose reductase